MRWLNDATGYGAVTRALHWVVFALFVHQFVGANLMTRIGGEATVAGWSRDALYNGHKSIGLVVLAVVLLRITWRRTTPLPEWSDALVEAERAIVVRLETALYGLMLLLPLSGYVYVVAGGYGVRLFGLWDLPSPFGRLEGLATTARVLHVVLAYAAVAIVAWHVGLGARKNLVDGARYLQRMAPFGDRR